jgi:hypothetical protein
MLTSLLVWSNRKLLDCEVPRADLPRLCPHPPDEAEASVLELADGGWITDDGTTLTIRFHANYQQSRETVLAIQERNQKNGAKGGRPPKATREQWTVTQTETQMGSEMGSQVGSETGEETQMGSQLETQGDGTGLEEVNATISESGGPDVADLKWKTRSIPNADCAACGKPFASPDPERIIVCPAQDDAHALARAAYR